MSWRCPACPVELGDWEGMRAHIATAHPGHDGSPLAAAPPLPAIFECGCSIHKVRAGLCDIYDTDGRPRTGAAVPPVTAADAPLTEAKPGEEQLVYAVRAKTLRTWSWHPEEGQTRGTGTAAYVGQGIVGCLVLPGTFGLVVGSPALDAQMRFQCIRWQMVYRTDPHSGEGDELNVAPQDIEFVSGVLAAVAFDRPPAPKDHPGPPPPRPEPPPNRAIREGDSGPRPDSLRGRARRAAGW